MRHAQFQVSLVMKALTGLPTQAYAQVGEEAKIPVADLLLLVQALESNLDPSFIARYRPDISAGIDESTIRLVHTRLREYGDLADRKITVLTSLGRQDRLTPELRAQVESVRSRRDLEDLFAPFKPKPRSAADDAVDAGLEGLARFLWGQEQGEIATEATKYVDSEKNVPDTDTALAGARAIMARWLAENGEVRSDLRRIAGEGSAVAVEEVPLQRKLSAKDGAARQRYSGLFGKSLSATSMPWKQILNLRRGAREGWLRYAIQLPRDKCLDYLRQRLIQDPESPLAGQLGTAAEYALDNYLGHGLEGFVRQSLEDRCDTEAIAAYEKNLKRTLMQAPVGQKVVIGIETNRPGGWRAAVIGVDGELLEAAIVKADPFVQARETVRSKTNAPATDVPVATETATAMVESSVSSETESDQESPVVEAVAQNDAPETTSDTAGQSQESEVSEVSTDTPEAVADPAPTKTESGQESAVVEAVTQNDAPETTSDAAVQSQESEVSEVSADTPEAVADPASAEPGSDQESAVVEAVAQNDASETTPEAAGQSQESDASEVSTDTSEAVVAPAPAETGSDQESAVLEAVAHNDAPETTPEAAAQSQESEASEVSTDTPAAVADPISAETGSDQESPVAEAATQNNAPETTPEATAQSHESDASEVSTDTPEAVADLAPSDGEQASDAATAKSETVPAASLDDESPDAVAEVTAESKLNPADRATTDGLDAAAVETPEAVSREAAVSSPTPTAAKQAPKAKKQLKRIETAQADLAELIRKHNPAYVILGNGPRVRQVERFVRAAVKKSGKRVSWMTINEAGSWIYATSRAARKEFPNAEPAVRAAACLARRLQDPLAEMSKLDPRVLGVGQGHHEVDQKSLRDALQRQASACASAVGVDINRAPAEVLELLPAMTDRVAKRIVEYREKAGPLPNLAAADKMPGMNKRVWEQASGYFRVYGGDNPLDGTGVRPVLYVKTQELLDAAGISVQEAIENQEKLGALDLEPFVDPKHPKVVLESIVKEFSPDRLDPRGPFNESKSGNGLDAIGEPKSGMKVPGIVTNSASFGVFVDIGAEQDGLLHISQLTEDMVSDDRPKVKPGTKLTVFITYFDSQTGKLSLSMREPRETSRQRRTSPAARREAGGGGRRREGGGNWQRPERTPMTRTFGPDNQQQAQARAKVENMSLGEKMAALGDKFRTKV